MWCYLHLWWYFQGLKWQQTLMVKQSLHQQTTQRMNKKFRCKICSFTCICSCVRAWKRTLKVDFILSGEMYYSSTTGSLLPDRLSRRNRTGIDFTKLGTQNKQTMSTRFVPTSYNHTLNVPWLHILNILSFFSSPLKVLIRLKTNFRSHLGGSSLCVRPTY